MNMKTILLYAALVIAGVVFAGRIRNLPGGKSLPTL